LPSLEILLVRHGPGRGRIPNYLFQILDALSPAVRERIRLHFTGAAAPDLDGVAAVVFWLADPLREHYPACFAEAIAIAETARARGLRIVNPPEALSNTRKSVQARLWREAGLPTPAQRRFESRAELEEVVAATPFPLLVRGDELHGREGTHLCRTRKDVTRLNGLCLPGAVALFVDTRAGWRRARPDSAWARFFHKKRVFVLGDVVKTNHVFLSKAPLVSMANSTFRFCGKLWRKRPLEFLTARKAYDECLAIDYDYWAGEPEDPELMRRAVRALGLDFAAVDFSCTADGGIVLWEANPHFDLPPWFRNVAPGPRRLEERHAGLHRAFERFFAEL